jgi:hypothetical protein
MPLAMVMKVPDGATDHDLSVACIRDFFSDVQFQEEKACLFLMAIWRFFLLGSLLFAIISSYSLSVCTYNTGPAAASGGSRALKN